MIEVLVSAAITGQAAALKRGGELGDPADFTGLYLAYQPHLVGDPAAGAEATERLLEELSANGAPLPGENGRRQRTHALTDGHVEIDEDAATLLAELSHHLHGLRWPPQLARTPPCYQRWT